MPIFVTQGRYSRDAIKGMLAKPEDRMEAASKLAQAAGGKLLAYYVTFGEYDWLVVSEMPARMTAWLDRCFVVPMFSSCRSVALQLACRAFEAACSLVRSDTSRRLGHA